MGVFSEALHPRGWHGRFISKGVGKPKLSHSVRLSAHSVSYNAGARVAVVPGKYHVYAGALVRVERTPSGALKAHTDKLVDKALGKHANTKIGHAIKSREANFGNLKVKGPDKIINNPSFRVSQSNRARPSVNPRPIGYTAQNSVRNPVAIGTASTRSPRRKARQPLVNGRRVRR